MKELKKLFVSFGIAALISTPCIAQTLNTNLFSVDVPSNWKTTFAGKGEDLAISIKSPDSTKQFFSFQTLLFTFDAQTKYIATQNAKMDSNFIPLARLVLIQNVTPQNVVNKLNSIIASNPEFIGNSPIPKISNASIKVLESYKNNNSVKMGLYFTFINQSKNYEGMMSFNYSIISNQPALKIAKISNLCAIIAPKGQLNSNSSNFTKILNSFKVKYNSTQYSQPRYSQPNYDVYNNSYEQNQAAEERQNKQFSNYILDRYPRSDIYVP